MTPTLTPPDWEPEPEPEEREPPAHLSWPIWKPLAWLLPVLVVLLTIYVMARTDV